MISNSKKIVNPNVYTNNKIIPLYFLHGPSPLPPPQLAEQQTFFIISVNICVNYLFATMLKTIKI
jgi:hypothetical protein